MCKFNLIQEVFMKSFKNWRIATKIMSISVFTIAVVVAGMLFYIMPLMEKKLMNEKKNALKNVVDVTMTLAASYEAQSQSRCHENRGCTKGRACRYQELCAIRAMSIL